MMAPMETEVAEATAAMGDMAHNQGKVVLPAQADHPTAPMAPQAKSAHSPVKGRNSGTVIAAHRRATQNAVRQAVVHLIRTRTSLRPESPKNFCANCFPPPSGQAAL
jgi:hypothetical protein